jgi:LysM repeat protein
MKRKLRIPNLFTFRRKRLRATTPRRSLRIAATARGEALAEPNMRLSRALLIVLLLHVVAVGGILAFNAIKTRQGSTASVTVAANPANQTVRSTARTGSLNVPPASEGVARDERNSRSAAKSTAKDSKTSSSSGKTYTVAKGDNPVTIAKKFKVSYDDLLALNHIEDPRKLQIGQKLLIPTKPAKPKKIDE